MDMTKVLFCDRNDKYYQANISDFIQLVKRLTNWDLYFIDDLSHYSDKPNEWLDDVRSKISDADILVSFNGMNFLKSAGHFKDEFQKQLIKKIQSGTPIFARLWEYPYESIEDLMVPVCNVIGATPLYYRVYSKTNRPENDPNPYCTLFDKAKDALRDPDLFKGVNSVYADSATLINYDPVLFPMIDADPSSYRLVDPGDLFFKGSLGMKNTIAVRGDRFDSVQILYTGDMFINPFTDMMGRMHYGLQKNIKFAENIISYLDAAISKPMLYEAKCYELFNQLERRLGLLIEKQLSTEQILTWIKEHSEQVKLIRSNLGQLNFIELTNIICSHWKMFDSQILMDKEAFRHKCNGINKKERRYLAHPIKALRDGYNFSENSTLLIKQVLEALRINS
jgi:ABC-type cobalt transport system substrate-binding protein